ncbi:hypothetical protein [Polyangium sp. 6x1]|uniref:hypothetical protein n=1 Tax=Polyangium sp. 6x1 TaxID=3042689 RepID=UPI002482C410|nr:hypothetical protein [Polyangium sp. 6x1]MDI1443608.1 hypothetical protein [Polyangium sp. 6x1]
MTHAPLGYLFCRSLLPGQSSHTERGKTFSLSPEEGETILLFRTDDRLPARDPHGRPRESFCGYFGIEDDEPRADLFLLFIKRTTDGEHMIRLVVVELKGGHLDRAVEQLRRTLRVLKQKLTPVLGPAFFVPGNVRALIITDNGSPRQMDRGMQQQFFKEFGVSPVVCRSSKTARENILKS